MINIGWQLMRQLPKDLAPWKHLVIINYDYVPKFSLSCDDNLGHVKKKKYKWEDLIAPWANLSFDSGLANI